MLVAYLLWLTSTRDSYVCFYFDVDKSLQPFLDQIDQIEDNVTSLEQAAYKLDAYSKRLGKLFLISIT